MSLGLLAMNGLINHILMKIIILTLMYYIIHSYNSNNQLEETNVSVCENIILTLFQQFISINHVYNIFQWNTYMWLIRY